MRRPPSRPIPACAAVSCGALVAIALLPASVSAAPAPPTDVIAPSLPGTALPAVIVRLHDDDPATLRRFAVLSGVQRLDPRAGRWPVVTLALQDGVDPERFAASLREHPLVRWAEPDRLVRLEPHDLPIDDLYATDLWHLENRAQNEGALPGADINVSPAWAITRGEGQIIAIIDGGVELTHPDLFILEPGIDGIDGDTVAQPGEAQDNPGHGTAVAGVAAAIGNNGIGVAGVAYAASILPVRLIGGEVPVSAMYDAFVQAVDRGATVLNNSWGFIPQEPCAPIGSIGALDEAVRYAQIEGRGGLGTVVVFSAGNAGCEQNDYPLLRDNENVIAVGSLTDQDRKWAYSVWGNHVDLAAPSGPAGGGGRPGLLSTDTFGDAGFNGLGDQNEYTAAMGGTSGAAPVVSGVVALMLAANPRLTEADVRRVLCATAVRVDPVGAEYDATGWSPFIGCGRVDAGAAVLAVANGAPPMPVVVAPEAGGVVRLGEGAITLALGPDPDGDRLTFDLELTPVDVDVADPEDPPGIELRRGLSGTAYVPKGQGWATGRWSLRVAARDRYGLGAWSEPQELELRWPEEPPAPVPPEQGCSASAAPRRPLSLLAALLTLAALRTTRSGSRGRSGRRRPLAPPSR